MEIVEHEHQNYLRYLGREGKKGKKGWTFKFQVTRA